MVYEIMLKSIHRRKCKMSLINCPECGKEISDKALNCPNCGAPVELDKIQYPQNIKTLNPTQQKGTASKNTRENSMENQQHNLKPYYAKTKVAGQTSRLVIGIISCCLFPIIALQSCAAGVSNALGDTGEVSGTFGILFAMLLLVAGIISIAMRKSENKVSYILPMCFYTIGSLLSAIGAGSYGDLFIWCSVGILFASIILFNFLNRIDTGKVASFIIPIVFFIILVGIVNFFRPEEKEEHISVPTENDVIEEMQSATQEPEENADNVGKKDSESEINVEVLAEYTLPDGIGWYTRHFIVIKNNSSETVDVFTSSLAYSEDGTMVSAADASFDALGAGCTSVLYEAFETDAEIDHYDTTLNASKSKYYESVIQDLSYIQNDIDGGAVFQVTNNGENPAEFVQGYALFFSGDELVGYADSYFVDDDSELKSGETISKQLDYHKEFDRIEFYLTGRR